jgi:hypothetical protein
MVTDLSRNVGSEETYGQDRVSLRFLDEGEREN